MDKRRHEKEDHWMSVSDLMAGLMLLFLLIVIIKMKDVRDKTKEFAHLVEITEQTKEVEKQQIIEHKLIEILLSKFIQDEEKLYQALKEEFKYDLEKWGAKLDRDTLAIVFDSPDVLFKKAESKVPQEYKDILDDFFPRYIRVLRTHEKIIDKVRIEGHTSSEWNNRSTKEQAYFGNMGLSQARTRAVLEYSMMLPQSKQHWDWAKKHVTADGLSSSRPIMTTMKAELENAGDNKLNLDFKAEDKVKSRRVEFRILTTAREVLNRIRNISK